MYVSMVIFNKFAIPLNELYRVSTTFIVKSSRGCNDVPTGVCRCLGYLDIVVLEPVPAVIDGHKDVRNYILDLNCLMGTGVQTPKPFLTTPSPSSAFLIHPILGLVQMLFLCLKIH
jgi:hypothetical protein